MRLSRAAGLLVALVAAQGRLAAAARSLLRQPAEPELIAKKLSVLEDDWQAQVAIFVECLADGDPEAPGTPCARVPGLFQQSCTAIAGAFVKGQGGDSNALRAFMDGVCGSKGQTTEHQELCLNLKVELLNGMSAANQEFDQIATCNNLWSRLIQRQKQVNEAKETQQRAEQQRADQQRAEKQRAEQRAEQQRAEQQRVEQLRIEKQRAEQQRAKEQQAEQQRAEQQREEQQRAEEQRAEQQRAEQQHEEQQQAEERQREEQQREERQHAEQQRAEERQREERQRATQRMEQQRAEQQHVEQQHAEQQRAEQQRKQHGGDGVEGQKAAVAQQEGGQDSQDTQISSQERNATQPHAPQRSSVMDHGVQVRKVGKPGDREAMERSLLDRWREEQAAKQQLRKRQRAQASMSRAVRAAIEADAALQSSEQRRKKAEEAAEAAQRALDEALAAQQHLKEVASQKKKERVVREITERKRRAAEARQRRKDLEEAKLHKKAAEGHMEEAGIGNPAKQKQSKDDARKEFPKQGPLEQRPVEHRPNEKSQGVNAQEDLKQHGPKVTRKPQRITAEDTKNIDAAKSLTLSLAKQRPKEEQPKSKKESGGEVPEQKHLGHNLSKQSHRASKAKVQTQKRTVKAIKGAEVRGKRRVKHEVSSAPENAAAKVAKKAMERALEEEKRTKAKIAERKHQAAEARRTSRKVWLTGRTEGHHRGKEEQHRPVEDHVRKEPAPTQPHQAVLKKLAEKAQAEPKVAYEDGVARRQAAASDEDEEEEEEGAIEEQHGVKGGAEELPEMQHNADLEAPVDGAAEDDRDGGDAAAREGSPGPGLALRASEEASQEQDTDGGGAQQVAEAAESGEGAQEPEAEKVTEEGGSQGHGDEDTLPPQVVPEATATQDQQTVEATAQQDISDTDEDDPSS